MVKQRKWFVLLEVSRKSNSFTKHAQQTIWLGQSHHWGLFVALHSSQQPLWNLSWNISQLEIWSLIAALVQCTAHGANLLYWAVTVTAQPYEHSGCWEEFLLQWSSARLRRLVPMVYIEQGNPARGSCAGRASQKSKMSVQILKQFNNFLS